jgi:hypothetical protein
VRDGGDPVREVDVSGEQRSGIRHGSQVLSHRRELKFRPTYGQRSAGTKVPAYVRTGRSRQPAK